MQNVVKESVELQHFVPYRMVHLAANISEALSKIYKQEFDINIAQWRVLAQLAQQQKLYSKDIGKKTAMDKSKVSRAVKTLEARHYLQRHVDPKDNRAAYLSLTAQGKLLYQKIVPKALQWESELLNVLTTSERNNLMTILDKLGAQILSINKN